MAIKVTAQELARVRSKYGVNKDEEEKDKEDELTRIRRKYAPERLKEEPTPTPEPEEEGVISKVKKKLGGIFKTKEDHEADRIATEELQPAPVSAPKKAEGYKFETAEDTAVEFNKVESSVQGEYLIEKKDPLYKKFVDAYLDFPSIFPNPDRLGFEISTTREQLENKAAMEARAKFWSNPIDNSIESARNVLAAHPKALEVLAEAQNVFENFEYTEPISGNKVPVGLNKNPLHRGIAKDISNKLLGSSREVQTVFDKPLIYPYEKTGQVYETVGEIIGGVMTYVAGGSILKGLEFGRLTLPVLFATIGQTSASPDTTAEQRLLKLPVDLIEGYLFSLLPVLKKGGITSENLKILGKGGVFSGATGGTAEFIDALIEGKSKEEAFELAMTAAATSSLFYIVGTSIRLLDDEIRGVKEIKGEGTFTPEEVRQYVKNTGLENDKDFKGLMELADQAEKEGGNIKLNLTKFQQGVAGKKLGIEPKQPEGLVGVAEIVDKVTPPKTKAPTKEGKAISIGEPVVPPKTAPIVPKVPVAPVKREVVKIDKTKYEGVTAAQFTVRPDGTVALNIEIDEASQKKGQGTRITRELEEKAIEQGHTEAVLPVKEESVGFFEKMGYESTGEVKNGIVEMTKTLSEENLPEVKVVTPQKEKKPTLESTTERDEGGKEAKRDRKSTRLNSSHCSRSRMPSSA